MEGLFGDMDDPDLDDPGGDGSPESPSGTASQTGSQVVVDSQPLVDVVSESGMSDHRGSLVSVAASQKYTIPLGVVLVGCWLDSTEMDAYLSQLCFDLEFLFELNYFSTSNCKKQ